MHIKSIPINRVIFLFAALVFVGWQFELVFRSPILSLAIFISFILYIVTLRSEFVIRYVYVFFIVCTNVIGVYVCESGSVYLDELGLYSSYVGSLSLNVLTQMVFLLTLLFLDERSVKDNDNVHINVKHTNKWADLAITGCLILSLISLALSATHPFFSAGVDRFLYRELGPAQATAVRLNTLIKNLIPVALIAYKNGYRYRAIGFGVTYCISAFLTGEKFGLFMLVLSVTMLAIIPYIKSFSKKTIRKYFVIAISVLMALVAVVLIHNHVVYSYTLDDNIMYLERRLAQQGQLWWRTYQLQGENDPHLDEFKGETEVWFNREANPYDGTYGIYKIMKMDVADPNLFIRKLDNGSSYTYSTHASIFYYFGIPGLFIFSITSATVYSFLVRLIVESIASNQILGSIVLMRFLVLAHGILTQSNFFELFDWKVIFYAVAYCFLRLLYASSAKSGKNKELLAKRLENLELV